MFVVISNVDVNRIIRVIPIFSFFESNNDRILYKPIEMNNINTVYKNDGHLSGIIFFIPNIGKRYLKAYNIIIMNISEKYFSEFRFSDILYKVPTIPKNTYTKNPNVIGNIQIEPTKFEVVWDVKNLASANKVSTKPMYISWKNG